MTSSEHSSSCFAPPRPRLFHHFCSLAHLLYHRSPLFSFVSQQRTRGTVSHSAPEQFSSSDLQWPAGRGVRVDTWLSSSSFQSLWGWSVGTDFDSLLAKIIVRDESFEKATHKARRALHEFTLAPNSKIKTNIDVLAGVMEHPDWKSDTINTFWLERNLEAVLSLGESVIGARNKDVVRLQAMPDLQQRSADGSNAMLGMNTLLQPGSLFHLTLTPASSSPSCSSSGSFESKKHLLTLASITHNAFPQRLSGVLQSTLSSTPLAFSLSRSTSAVINSGGFEPADLNDPLQVAAPLSGKITEVHSTLKAADAGEKKVKKGETLVVLSAMKMETVVSAPHDGIIEKVGKGLKTGVIINEGMLICVVRPVGISRL